MIFTFSNDGIEIIKKKKGEKSLKSMLEISKCYRYRENTVKMKHIFVTYKLTWRGGKKMKEGIQKKKGGNEKWSKNKAWNKIR